MYTVYLDGLVCADENVLHAVYYLGGNEILMLGADGNGDFGGGNLEFGNIHHIFGIEACVCAE